MHISEIEDFFSEYTQAYLTFDANALIKFFYFPCLIHDSAGVHLINNEQDIKTYSQNLLARLKQLRLAKIENKILGHNLSKNLPEAVGCQVAYRFLDANNAVIMEFNYSYSLIKNKQWQILFARLGTVK